MKRMTKHALSGLFSFVVMMVFSPSGKLNAQIVTNGDFESSSVGVVTGADVTGWLIEVADTVKPKPVFEIVNDTVEQGSRALKVTVHGLGVNQWDIQIVASNIHVRPGIPYNYSIWAKSQKAGATVNFTTWSAAAGEYGAIRPATLTTRWQKYSMQFTVTDTSTYIMGPIHFYGTVDTGNAIYIDNLQIVDPNASKEPTVVEAESGALGSNFPTLRDSNVTYVEVDSNSINAGNPGDTSRVITYQIQFPDSGMYNLFARVRVDSGSGSFFYGNGFGLKDAASNGDWVAVNGLDSAGFSDPAYFVDGPGIVGVGIWKWVNLTNNAYQGAKGSSFSVTLDSLTRTFQIGGGVHGLDIDKLAFGKSYLHFRVSNLDKGGVGILSPADIYNGPALAAGLTKFLGNTDDSPDSNFANYWNQTTAGNVGKWGSVGTTQDSTQWDWSGLDRVYNYTQSHNIVFKDHNLIWGQQQPSWISALDSATQYRYIETWIRMVGQRYPKINLVDVVNEPLTGHNPPDGTNGGANYEKALGGKGATGWDWVITAFRLAREYMPANTKLLINDYNVINDNSATTSYVQIINLLKGQGLIDGIGLQCHDGEIENTDTTTLRGNLVRLAGTGVPIYISEMDLGNLSNAGTPNDTYQEQQYQKLFPMFWQFPDVKGITLWGYKENEMWAPTSSSFLVRSDGTARPALLWMANYIKNNPLAGVQTSLNLPSAFRLEQNFPNPFNPSTNISYSVASTSKVTLRIFDILGREVQTLVNMTQVPGQYAVTFNAGNLASGVYFYQLNAGSFTQTKKLMLLK